MACHAISEPYIFRKFIPAGCEYDKKEQNITNPI